MSRGVDDGQVEMGGQGQRQQQFVGSKPPQQHL